MKAVFIIVAVTCAPLMMTLSSCAHRETPAEQAMEFDPGIKTLARELALQLENTGIGKTLNKVVVDPATNRRSLRKLVVEPFIDTETGQPVKLNALISSMMSVEMANHFSFPSVPDHSSVEVTEYVVTGMVTPAGEGPDEKFYSINAAVYDKLTGVVLASVESRITGLDGYRTRSRPIGPAPLSGSGDSKDGR